MAAMTLEPRDPDMSNFIDAYKFERQMAERRDKFGGGTSLPLNSDGYEDRQRFLREERHKDWAEQQEKDISYKPTINPYPHPKLTSGPQNPRNYDVEIQKMTDRYHNKYDDVLVKGNEQQRKIEQERLEQRRQNRQPPAPPQANQIDYNQAHELTKAEDRRAYQDYQGKFSIPMEGKMHVRPPISYEENKKVLAEERRREYGLYQEQKAKEERYRAMRGRPVTPAGGLDIGKYDRQVKEEAASKKKEYKSMLDQQQKEQRFLKAQQEPEISVLDRKQASHSPYLATKPPAGPAYKPRDEPTRQTPSFWNEGHRAQSPKSVTSEAQRRQRDDGVPLEDERHNKLSHRPVGKPAEVVKGPYYNSDNYESFQNDLRQKQLDEYRDYLKKNYQPPPGAAGLPLEQARYEPKRLAMEAERNAEYNKHLKKSPRDLEKSKGPQGLPLDPKQSTDKAKWLEKQRNKEYNDFLQKEQEARQINYYEDIPNPFLPPPIHNPRLPEPYQTNPHIYQQTMRAPYPKAASAPGALPVTPGKLSLPVGQYDDLRPFLIKQRNKDYNSYREQLPPVRRPRMTPQATAIDVSLPLGEYDEQRPLIERQRIDEFNKLLIAEKQTNKSPREKAHTPPYLQGLPIGQHHYEPLYRAMEYQRNRDYNEFINKKFQQQERKARSEPDRANKASFVLGNDFIHAEKRRFLEAERQKEYNDYLKKRPQAPSKDIAIPTDTESGLPIGQQHHEVWKKFLRDQRNREYNQLVEKTTHAPRNRSWKESENGLLLPEDHTIEYKKRELQAERKREYNEHLAQQRMHEVPRRDNYGSNVQGPYNGMFHGLGEHGNQKDELNLQRRQDYNNRLDQQYTQRERPSGRPSWAKDPVMDEPGDGGRPTVRSPVKGDQYGDMLNEKRREEAQRRRFDDPEYQDKLARIDSRERRGPSLDQPRYGY